MMSKKLVVPLSMIVLFCFSSTCISGGLHFGIIDAVKDKIDELREEKTKEGRVEIDQGQTDSTGHARFYSELIGDQIDVEVKDEGGDPVENLDVTYITDGEKVSVRISDPAGNYYSELAEQNVSSVVFITIIVVAVVVSLGFPIARIVIWQYSCFPSPPALGGTMKTRGSGSLDDVVATIKELGYHNVRVCSEVSSTLGIEEGKSFEMQLFSAASSADWKRNFLEKGFREDAVYEYGYYEVLFRGDPVLEEPFWIYDVEVEEACTGYLTLGAWRDEPPSEAALAEEKRFYAAPSVYRWTLSEFRLSQDGGASWTENLLTSPTADFASVGIGQKVGEFISDKALACGQHNRWKYTVSGLIVKGVVAVNPTEWGGTWEDGTTGVRYYYTNTAGRGDKYKGSSTEAETAAEEFGPVAVSNPAREGACDFGISASETMISKYWLGGQVIYIAHYGGDNKFTHGSWCFRDSSRLEF